MKQFVTVSIVCMALSGCLGGQAEQAATDIARSQAKGVVNGVVKNRFPGVNAAPVTDCIIDNASLNEIFDIAKAAVTGVTAETTNVVVDIAKRPATVKCIVEKSVANFGSLPIDFS